MPQIIIDEEKCKKDGICVAECPFKLLTQQNDGIPAMRDAGAKICIECGHCVAVCPHRALSLTTLGPDDCLPVPNGPVPSISKTAQMLKGRRSIRSYTTDPVSRDYMKQILDVCRWAPTAKNVQPVQWLIIEKRDEVRLIAENVVGWLRGNGNYPGIVAAWDDSGADMVLRDAPHLAVAYAHKDSIKPDVDCTIAMTYFDLAANSLGVGTCWAGMLMSAAANGHQPLLDALDLPADHKLFGAMMFGYPKYNYFRVPPRKPLHITWR